MTSRKMPKWVALLSSIHGTSDYEQPNMLKGGENDLICGREASGIPV